MKQERGWRRDHGTADGPREERRKKFMTMTWGIQRKGNTGVVKMLDTKPFQVIGSSMFLATTDLQSTTQLYTASSYQSLTVFHSMF